MKLLRSRGWLTNLGNIFSVSYTDCETQPTSVGPIWLLIWSLGLRWIILLLLVVIWRKILRTRTPPTIPNARKSLWVGNSSLERWTSWKTWLWWWQMIEFFFIFQAVSIIFLITGCPFFSWTQWHTGAVSWHTRRSRSVILPETYETTNLVKLKL